MIVRSIARLAAVAMLVPMAFGVQANEALDAAFERDVAILIGKESGCHRFDIYLALTGEQQRRGLMFIRELPDTTGMLFVYRDDRTLSIWMKNTFLPLDVIFADAGGTVLNIHYSAEPQSLASMRSAGPARYVLEVNAGIADTYSIEPGSRILWGPTFDAR